MGNSLSPRSGKHSVSIMAEFLYDKSGRPPLSHIYLSTDNLVHTMSLQTQTPPLTPSKQPDPKQNTCTFFVEVRTPSHHSLQIQIHWRTTERKPDTARGAWSRRRCLSSAVALNNRSEGLVSQIAALISPADGQLTTFPRRLFPHAKRVARSPWTWSSASVHEQEAPPRNRPVGRGEGEPNQRRCTGCKTKQPEYFVTSTMTV